MEAGCLTEHTLRTIRRLDDPSAGYSARISSLQSALLEVRFLQSSGEYAQWTELSTIADQLKGAITEHYESDEDYERAIAEHFACDEDTDDDIHSAPATPEALPAAPHLPQPSRSNEVRQLPLLV